MGRKAVWHDWGPTDTMVSLKPDLPHFRKNGSDILFRIHSTNEPWTVGDQVSSGCIRMLNEDIADLYNHVPVGTTVLVRRNGRWRVSRRLHGQTTRIGQSAATVAASSEEVEPL